MLFSKKTASVLALSALALASCSKTKHNDSPKFIPGGDAVPVSISQRTAQDFVGHWELTDASGLTTVDIAQNGDIYTVTTTNADGSKTTSENIQAELEFEGYISLEAKDITLSDSTYSIAINRRNTDAMYVGTLLNPKDTSRAFTKTGDTPNPAFVTPAQVETPAQFETPVAHIETPAQFETPAQVETPAQFETPAQVETPAQFETPAQVETPAQFETPAQVETPAQFETPVGQ